MSTGVLRTDFKQIVDPIINSGKLDALSSGVAAALGLVDELDSVVKFGHCPDAGSAETDAWEPGNSQPTYIFVGDAGEGMTIQSDEDGDNQSIKVFLLDVAGLEYIVNVNLNGQSPVVIAGTFIAFNRAFNDDSTPFVGNVSIKGITSGNIFGYIDAREQQTTQCIYTVPSDKYALVRNMSSSINRGGNQDTVAIVKLLAQEDGGVFRTQVRYGLQKRGTSNLSSDLVIPALYPPLTRIKISIEPDAAGVDISAEFSAQLIDAGLVAEMQAG